MSATGGFDELLRRSLDEAERFYAWLIERAPDHARVNQARLDHIVHQTRRELGVVPWPGDAPVADACASGG